MAVIPQKQLRNQVGAVLRRAEAGEEITVTVSGRPVARLGPMDRSPWVAAPSVAAVWDSDTPIGLTEDLERLAGDLVDPFAPPFDPE